VKSTLSVNHKIGEKYSQAQHIYNYTIVIECYYLCTKAQILTFYDNCIIVKYIVSLDCTFLLFYDLLLRNGWTAQKRNFKRSLQVNRNLCLEL
jgi:hypothetical protein